MKVLVIRFSSLGDVAMLVPVVKELVSVVPDVEVTVLSQPFCASLFNGISDRVHFMGADIKGEYRGMKGLGCLFNKLNAMNFDYVADMHGVLRTHYLSLRFRLSGYKVAKIDKQRKNRHALTAVEGKKRMVQLSTSFDKYRNVFYHLGIVDYGKLADYSEENKDVPVISFSSVDSDVEKLLDGCTGGKRIGIAPFAAHAGKIYPLEKMERVIDTIVLKNPDARIFLFGGGGKERDRMLSWQKRWNNVVVVSTILHSMEKELQLMSCLDVMLSMDSANMHLASLVGTRVVSIWGATHPYAGFLGFRQKYSDCIQLPLPCRPCSIFGNKPCHRKDFACMNDIPVEEVVKILV